MLSTVRKSQRRDGLSFVCMWRVKQDREYRKDVRNIKYFATSSKENEVLGTR